MSEAAARPRILLLAVEGTSTRVVFHALRARFGEVAVVLEEHVPAGTLLRRRARRLGWLVVAGQLLFAAAQAAWLRPRARRRLREIAREHGCNDAPIDGRVVRVASVNAPETPALLRELAPDVIVVNGTRIIGERTLRALDVPFINMHAGITPRYRGVHGGYWALVEGRADLVGTTVHRVDLGIDTGPVIAQATFEPSPDDSFPTYPLRHVAAGIAPLLDAVERALAGTLADRPPMTDLPSRLWSHPTLAQYLWHRLRRGVR